MMGRASRSLNPLLELGDGRVLACTDAGDKYYVLNPETEQAQTISLPEAAQLWLEGERKGWKRPSQEPTAPAESAESILNMDSKTWREELRRKLGYTEKE